MVRDATPTPWERRRAQVDAERSARTVALEEASSLPCAGWGAHTTYTVDAKRGVRLCWACAARGYTLDTRPALTV